MRRDGDLPPLHLQLAGPAARPRGHPGHDFVLPELVIGEYPTPEDATWLRDAHGFGAVVSLQDDVDLQRKGLSPGGLEDAYTAMGIAFVRHPAADGDLDAVRRVLDGAVASLHTQIGAGRRVYLHCNAGLNRAPTVAIAYLHVHRGLELEAARDRVKLARACLPYWRLLVDHYSG
ncbi:MAG: dual specificity protein phosphatase family protein [bacterium]